MHKNVNVDLGALDQLAKFSSCKAGQLPVGPGRFLVPWTLPSGMTSFTQPHFLARLTERISLLAPLRRIVQALGSLQSVMNVKYSSPIFLISNRPAPVPTSSSLSSSGRLTIRAPQALFEGENMERQAFTYLPSP